MAQIVDAHREAFQRNAWSCRNQIGQRSFFRFFAETENRETRHVSIVRVFEFTDYTCKSRLTCAPAGRKLPQLLAPAMEAFFAHFALPFAGFPV